QKIAQVEGVGQVFVGGGALPAVRVEANPTALNARGMSLEDLRGFLTTVNVNRPKGDIGWGDRDWSLWTNDQMRRAAEYGPLVVSYKSGAAVRLSDVARVEDSVEDTRTAGNANRKQAVIVVIFRQPGANIIETVERIMALLPQLQADLPPTMKLETPQDRTTTIRASVREVERTLMISIGLVILVVFAFLRSVRATL